jgi:hypothetical protein
MKIKKFGKKLVLNKETVTDLNGNSMDKVNGGIKTGITCGRLCDTVNWSCEETMCGTCFNTCPPTWCDTECGC